jgi:hypothetical protein
VTPYNFLGTMSPLNILSIRLSASSIASGDGGAYWTSGRIQTENYGFKVFAVPPPY